MSDPVARLRAALADRYDIERELGSGGMATVYLAQDIKHNRKVAVKVLKPELAAVLGADRFVQEIETTANLQHPHILPLFDSGEAEGFLYYVMPYIDGETVRDKLDRETQFGIEEAVRITTEIADALDYAHRNEVIHRDIKPENILLHDGRPMVADFGIALALSAAAGGRMTETGMSLGTPHYMSPEQATADKDVSNRSDVYSLATVLYEMLTGDPPHTGSSAQAIVMKILTEEVQPVAELRKSVPGNVAAATGKALEKLAADRFATAKEFAEALMNPAFAVASAGAGVGAVTGGGWRTKLAVPFAVMAALFALAFTWAMRRPQPDSQVHRFAVALPAGATAGVGGTTLALAADGSLIVYSGPGDDTFGQLWLRRSDELSATPIPGSVAGTTPAISVDGTELAWVKITSMTGGPLLVSPLRGGTPRTVAEGVFSTGLGWGPDGSLYYSYSEGIRRVRPGGGTQDVTVVDRSAGDLWHGGMDILPNGKAAVFAIRRGGESVIAAVQFDTGEISELAAGSFPRYAPTGHLIWGSGDGQIMAAPFDPKALALTGPAVSVLAGLRVPFGRPMDFAISETGILLYRSGSGARMVEPVWVDRAGAEEEIELGWVFDPSFLSSGLAISPDGSRVVIAIQESTTDLWIKRFGAGPASRLTFEGDRNFRPFWLPLAPSIGFISRRGEQNTVYQKPADGSGTAQVLWKIDVGIQEATVSQDGEWVVYRVGAAAGNRDLYAARLDEDSVVVPLATTEFGERSPALSPDGQWFAYVSDESGLNEVYVRPFPNAADGKWQVSSAGGREPMWAHNGRELFYRNGADELVVVAVTKEPTFGVGSSEVMFSAAGYMSDFNHVLYDVGPDDQRFVMLRVVPSAPGELIWVHNWFAELKELVGNE